MIRHMLIHVPQPKLPQTLLGGLSLGKVHIIGHSLGAHTSGFVGHAFNGQIGRITGLDPAGPGFNGMPASDKLNPSNAQFVDAIHSDAVLNTGAGIVENSGHLDFWPDNGKNHPGCTLSWLTSFQGGLTCNHFRAIDFYAASINPNNPKGVAHQCPDYSTYLAGKCDTDCADGVANCAIIGEQAVLSKPYESSTIGKRYYLSTNPSYPYFQVSGWKRDINSN
ncbi:unnamed protein product [Medioppia subpectinata]|uniref:Lipase domain-containing protein n=1 Tax=Medioppia subpectinata TaxID=1979941 RepID=A0A7R9L3C4_9ACAR|nr:unnamed protein product [Medioppia subpectinata]CAG2114659.1 unnamed protein product [Medioppia subpectinata]